LKPFRYHLEGKNQLIGVESCCQKLSITTQKKLLFLIVKPYILKAIKELCNSDECKEALKKFQNSDFYLLRRSFVTSVLLFSLPLFLENKFFRFSAFIFILLKGFFFNLFKDL